MRIKISHPGRNIYKRAGPHSTAGIVYGEEIGEGICQACGDGVEETLEHIMCHCKRYDEERKAMHVEINNVWQGAGALRYWREHEWLTTNLEGWKKVWGYQGFCPKTQGDNRRTIRCKKQTGKIALEHAYNIWEARNTVILGWEEEVGIKARKVEMGKKRWNVTFQGPARKRGRPTLRDDQLTSDNYREKRQLDEKKRTLVGQLGVVEGNKAYKRWREKEILHRKA
jgi:hypothetical protein